MARGYATDARQSLFYITPEATAGTYVAPSVGTTRAIRLTAQPSWSVGGTPKVTREDTIQSLPGGAPPVLGARFRSVSFECFLTEWDNTTDIDGDGQDSHELAAFLLACPVTITAGGDVDSPVTIKPAARGDATVSVTWAEENGDVHRIKGGRCTFTLSADESMLWKLQGTVTGLYIAVEDTATFSPSLNFATPNYTAQPIVRADNVLFNESIAGSQSLEGVRSAAFDPSIVVSERSDMTANENGYTLPFATHQGQATISLTCDALDEDDLAVFGDAEANNGNLFALTAKMANGDARLEVSLADAYLDFPDVGESGGMRTYDLVLRGVPSAGFDAYTISFY